MIAPIPVNVISGPLGVGKTTVINHLLTQRPGDERWAVLVNEYGLVGLDGALIGDESAGGTPLLLKEVAGGCICCSAGPVFEASLIQLLRRRPDRLLIEPTGLATLSGIVQTLRRQGIREAVDLRSIVCLLNPATLTRDLGRDEVRDQVEAADVIVATKVDLASAPELAAFDAWSDALFPRKRHIGALEHGRLAGAVLDMASDNARQATKGASTPHGHAHTIDHGHTRDAATTPANACESNPVLAHHHRSGRTTTIGWICWDGLVFESSESTRWITSLAALPTTRRIKAVLRTNEGWKSFNLSDDRAEAADQIRRCAPRRDSRLELILEDDAPPTVEALTQSLRKCLRASP